MLIEMIDGKEVVCSPEKEKLIRDYWVLNDKYPEYAGHCGWDGVNEPFHDMIQCRKHHQRLTSKAIELARADLNKRIEITEEAGDDFSYATRKQLIAQRANLRALESQDLSGCKTVDDLRASIPEPLNPYWSI